MPGEQRFAPVASTRWRRWTVSSTGESRRKYVVFFSTVAAVCAIDQLIKAFVVAYQSPGDSFRIFPGVRVTHVRNTGAAFGLFAGSGQVVFWVALGVVALALLWFFRSHGTGGSWYYLGIGLIVGGAVGNLLDRVFRGTVVDYVDLGWWPVFNLADVAIVSGVLSLLLLLVLDFREEGAEGSCEKKV